MHRGSKTRGGTLPGRGCPTCREMLQSGGQQPESRGGDAPQSQGGKTPQSEVPRPLERGPQSNGASNPRKSLTTSGGALTETPRKWGRPGPQKEGRSARWSLGLRGRWPRSPGPRAHSPSARPQAAPTAVRKRSINVFFLLSGSHITWHSRISPCPARGSLDMAAAGTTRGPEPAGEGGDGRGRLGGLGRELAASATERGKAAPVKTPGEPRPRRPRPPGPRPSRV